MRARVYAAPPIPLNTGIYKITNKTTGHIYIGSAVKLCNRFRLHKSELRRNVHGNRYLQSAWNKYGENNFVFSVLIFCDKENLLLYEQRFLDYYKPDYNLVMTAGNVLGMKMPESAKKKISEAQMGNKNGLGIKRDASVGRKISAAKMGHTVSEETRKKLSEINLNREPISDETREKLRGRTGDKHPLFGTHLSDETKKKKSESMKIWWKNKKELDNGNIS